MNSQLPWRGLHRLLILVVGVTATFIVAFVVPAGDSEEPSDLADRVWIHHSQWLDPPPKLAFTRRIAGHFAVFHSNGVFTNVATEALFVATEEPYVAFGGRSATTEHGWWSSSPSGNEVAVRYTGIGGPLPPKAIALAPDSMSIEIDGRTYFPADEHLSDELYRSLVRQYTILVRPIVEELAAEVPGA